MTNSLVWGWPLEKLSLTYYTTWLEKARTLQKIDWDMKEKRAKLSKLGLIHSSSISGKVYSIPLFAMVLWELPQHDTGWNKINFRGYEGNNFFSASLLCWKMMRLTWRAHYRTSFRVSCHQQHHHHFWKLSAYCTIPGMSRTSKDLVSNIYFNITAIDLMGSFGFLGDPRSIYISGAGLSNYITTCTVSALGFALLQGLFPSRSFTLS